MRTRGLVAMAVVALLPITACSPAPAARPTTTWAVLDADSRGAVVLGESETSQHLFGVRRDGSIAWQADDALARQTPTVVCSGGCPAAIASSPISVANPMAPTPLGGAGAVGSDEAGRPMSVLHVGKHGVVREVVDPAGISRLETPATAQRIEGRGTIWRTANNGASAVALTVAPDGNGTDVRVFTAVADGWRLNGGAHRSTGMFGCATADGTHRIVGEAAAVVLSSNTGRTPITGVESGGDCWFSTDTAVIAQYHATTSGARTKLVTVDLTGQVRSSAQYPFEARIAADIGGRGHIVVLSGHAEERDLLGRPLQRIEDVADARYTEDGDIISVSPSGKVRWTAGRSR